MATINTKTPSFFHLLSMLFCGTMLYFFVLFQRSAVPGPIFQLLQNELNDKSVVANLGAIFMYSYGITQLVAGLLVDRFGGRRVIMWGGLLMCIGALLFPLSNTVPWYYTARLLTGIGGGAIYLCLVKDAMLLPKQWYGMLIGAIVTIGFLGSIVANSPFVACVNRLNGHYDQVLLFAGLAMVFFYFAWMCTIIGLPKDNHNPETVFSIVPFVQVLKNSKNWQVFIFNSLNFALFCVLQTIIGHKFLEEYVGMEMSRAAMVFTATAAMTAISGLLFPVISKMTGERRGLICYVVGILTVLSFVILAGTMYFGIRLSWLPVALFMMLAFTMNTMVIVVPLLRSINTDATTGVAVGVLNFLNFIFVAIFGQLAGKLMECIGGGNDNNRAFLVFFVIMAALSVVELVCAAKLKHK